MSRSTKVTLFCDVTQCGFVVSRQQLDKHVPAATDAHATIHKLMEAVFSVVRVETVSTQHCGKHSPNNRRAIFYAVRAQGLSKGPVHSLV
jgi:hypothetical protein